MKTQVEQLSDEAIDAVSGGLTCQDAQTVSDAYAAIGQMFRNEGMIEVGTVYTAMATGVLIGGCRPSGK